MAIVSAALGLCGRVPFMAGTFTRCRACRRIAQDRGEHGNRCGVFDPFR